MRDELPSWCTPTVFKDSVHAELVTNSSNYIYGYNPDTGEELWRFGGTSSITTPTPIWYKNIILVCSGRHPEAAIFAIRPGARGDISPSENHTTNDMGELLMASPALSEGVMYVRAQDHLFAVARHVNDNK